MIGQDVDVNLVRKMPLTLRNIVVVLERALQQLDSNCQSDLVMLLGNTGDGKSTMLASLFYGADSLEERSQKII